MASSYTKSNLCSSERKRAMEKLSKGPVSSYMIDPGNFCGDELLSRCPRKTFNPRLPATFSSLDVREASVLDAQHLRYVTDHHRFKLANEKLKQTSCCYFTRWRTPAAVTNQSEWKRYEARPRTGFSSTSALFLAPGIANPYDGLFSDHGRLHVYVAAFVP